GEGICRMCRGEPCRVGSDIVDDGRHAVGDALTVPRREAVMPVGRADIVGVCSSIDPQIARVVSVELAIILVGATIQTSAKPRDGDRIGAWMLTTADILAVDILIGMAEDQEFLGIVARRVAGLCLTEILETDPSAVARRLWVGRAEITVEGNRT